MVADRFDFAGAPQGLVEIGPERDLAVIGEKAGHAAFERLEHGVAQSLRAEFGIIGDAQCRAAGNADHVVEGGDVLAQAGERCRIDRMRMDDRTGLRPRLEDVVMHAPFGRGQIVAAIAAIEIHLDDMLALHLVIGNPRGSDQEALHRCAR